VIEVLEAPDTLSAESCKEDPDSTEDGPGTLYFSYKVRAVDAAGMPVAGARVYAWITQTVGPTVTNGNVEAMHGFGKRKSMDLMHYYGSDVLSSLSTSYMFDSFECGVDDLVVNSTVTMNLGFEHPLHEKVGKIVRVKPATIAKKTVRATLALHHS
jgi:hypothetical protein